MNESSLVERHRGAAAFSLIELLVVLAVVSLLVAASLPALSAIEANRFTSNVRTVESTLNLARQIAASRNTYAWVLFASETDSKGQPELLIAVIDSKEGTDPVEWGAYSPTLPDDVLEMATPLVVLTGVALLDPGGVKVPNLPATGTVVGPASGATSIHLRIPARGVVTFRKAIRFSAATGGRVSDDDQSFVELDLQRLNGTVGDPRNVAVLRVDSATGRVQTYRP